MYVPSHDRLHKYIHMHPCSLKTEKRGIFALKCSPLFICVSPSGVCVSVLLPYLPSQRSHWWLRTPSANHKQASQKSHTEFVSVCLDADGRKAPWERLCILLLSQRRSHTLRQRLNYTVCNKDPVQHTWRFGWVWWKHWINGCGHSLSEL